MAGRAPTRNKDLGQKPALMWHPMQFFLQVTLWQGSSFRGAGHRHPAAAGPRGWRKSKDVLEEILNFRGGYHRKRFGRHHVCSFSGCESGEEEQGRAGEGGDCNR